MNEGLRARARTFAWAATRRAAQERELQLLTEAIVMVASGAAPRVVIAGLHHGATVIDPARRLALEAGVRLQARRMDGDGMELSVEPIRE